MTVGIIEYGAGNTRSVENALHTLGVETLVSGDAAQLSRTDRVILPGVGEAASAMEALRRRRLDLWLAEWQRPFLGICLGLQVLFESSEEADTRCLGILRGRVRRFRTPGLKVPHMGWNEVDVIASPPLFHRIRNGERFYFVHAFHAPGSPEAIATTEYGTEFTSAVQVGVKYGVQFHPEKSGDAGLTLLRNFLERC